MGSELVTAGIDEAPWQHGDLVTVADNEFVVLQHEGPWVDVVPETGDVGFTVHESEIRP